MDLTVEEYLKGLFSKEAHEQPSDAKKPEEEFTLPPWFDEKKFDKAREFFWYFSFSLITTMAYGLVAVFSVPSILQVLISSRRSSSPYTAYKRYLSTILHVVSWFENKLHPDSISWRSLYTVRKRHFSAGQAAKLKGHGIVSQRDLVLTQFGFFGFALLKPEIFSVYQLNEGDWDAYIHFWRTVGYAIGIEDRYNLCRETVEETRQACQYLLEKVYTPCLSNVPEYFEHMSRSMLEGLWCINPTVDVEAYLYMTKFLADVPGYIYSEKHRIELQKRILEHTKLKSADIGVDTTQLISKPVLELPNVLARPLYYNDYVSVERSPQYRRLQLPSTYRLSLNFIIFSVYSSYIGRLFLNSVFGWSLFLMKYFPYLAFFKFGVKSSYVNIFVEDPTDNTQLTPNSDYENPKPLSWFKIILSFF